MTSVKFRQLIDMAIGFPKLGHVNFSALHRLLTCIADKLDMTDETVDYFNKETFTVSFKDSEENLYIGSRLCGGVVRENQETASLDQNEEQTEDGAEVDADQEPPDEIEEPTEIFKEPPEMIKEPTEMFEEPPEIFKEPPEILEKPIFIAEPEAKTKPLSPKSSKASSKSSVKSLPSHISPYKLDERITKLEVSIQNITIPKEISSGIAIMKDQIEFAIEQLLLLTFLTLSKKPDTQQIQILYKMAQSLHELRKENTYIEGTRRINLPNVPSLNWHSSGLQLQESISENDILEVETSRNIHGSEVAKSSQCDVQGHLCYSPEKILDQLMALKSEMCLLTNKLNEISARLLQQESQHTLAIIRELQEQMRDTKLTLINLKETQSRLEARINSNTSNIDGIKRMMEQINIQKVDKEQLEIQLADKVDYNQLQRKVSLDQLLELQCRLDKKFCEILRQIHENEKKFIQIVDHLKETLGFAAIDGILKTFKENISKDIRALQELLKFYIDATNDDCAAAGARVKVLQDLACLSCDTNCVMSTMEKSKVAKLPTAHASNILSPLITYELCSIRKSGVMGYYRKDEFPHSTNAWLSRQNAQTTPTKGVVQRHAGGEHTTYNPRERVDKMMSNRK